MLRWTCSGNGGGDLETAIEESSTLIKVVITIFGQKKYPENYFWNEYKELK